MIKQKRYTLYKRQFYEGFMDDWKKFIQSMKDIKDTIKSGGSYKQLEKEQDKLKKHLSDIKSEIKDVHDRIKELQAKKKEYPTMDSIDKDEKIKDKEREKSKIKKSLQKIDVEIKKEEEKNLEALKASAEKVQEMITELRDKLVDMTPDEKD